MIQRIWYWLVYAYVWCGLRFYFSRIVVRGVNNIPEVGPVLFVANHQNALLDALLVATTHTRRMHFLARADLFKKKIMRTVLRSVNMAPIYRIRDGWSSLQNNEESFAYCRTVFAQQEALLIFPEGNHDLHRRLRPLSKGFTRIVLDVLSRDPHASLQIVPVGINYESHQHYFRGVSIYYGKPIQARDYYTGNFQSDASALRGVTSEAMKKLITHIDDLTTYAQLFKKLQVAGVDLLDPDATNECLTTLVKSHEKPAISRPWLKPVIWILQLINLPPRLVWRWLLPKIKDPVFVGTARFAVGITLFPLYYTMISVLLIWCVSFPGNYLLIILLLISMPVYGMATSRIAPAP